MVPPKFGTLFLQCTIQNTFTEQMQTMQMYSAVSVNVQMCVFMHGALKWTGIPSRREYSWHLLKMNEWMQLYGYDNISR